MGGGFPVTGGPLLGDPVGAPHADSNSSLRLLAFPPRQPAPVCQHLRLTADSRSDGQQEAAGNETDQVGKHGE